MFERGVELRAAHASRVQNQLPRFRLQVRALRHVEAKIGDVAIAVQLWQRQRVGRNCEPIRDDHTGQDRVRGKIDVEHVACGAVRTNERSRLLDGVTVRHVAGR